MLLLGVKTLASISVKVRRKNAKLLTPILHNVRPYSQGGVDDFSRLVTHLSAGTTCTCYLSFIALGNQGHAVEGITHQRCTKGDSQQLPGQLPFCKYSNLLLKCAY